MTSINWGLQDPNAFQRGYEQTKGVFDDMAAKRKQNALEAAMRNYAMNPDDPNTINALAQVDPLTAIKLRQQQAETRQREAKLKTEGIEAHRENIIKGAQLIRQLKPTDDATWQAALGQAQQLGIDISQVPKTFDQQYARNLIATADAFEPQKAEPRGRIITPQPGAGAYELDPDGSMRELIRPNDGSQPLGAPVGTPTNGIPPAALEMLRANPHLKGEFDQKYGQGAAARALGGQTATPSGNFP